MKNKQIQEILNNIIETKKIVNGYIFSGIGRTQNYEYAKKFAKRILCLEEEIKNNCKCKSCLSFDDDNHPDYFEINKASTESIKIEEIRNMQEKVIEKPITSKRKVYIINNAEQMTTEAQNCLLKTLEEPPEFITIILVSNNDNTILPTIKSRCTFLTFTEETIENLTEEEKEKYNELQEIFGNVEKYLSIDLLNKIDILYKDKENIYKNLEFINRIFIEKAKENIKYLDYIDYVEETKLKLERNSNFDMSIDYLILKVFDGKEEEE